MGAHRHSTHVSRGRGGPCTTGDGGIQLRGGEGYFLCGGGMIRNFLRCVIERCFILSNLYCGSSGALLMLVVKVQFTDCQLITSH